jgi:hypothetical protein
VASREAQRQLFSDACRRVSLRIRNSSGKSSIRSEENVVSFKHLVIESDIGKQHPEQPELWLRAAALLKLPIVSII